MLIIAYTVQELNSSDNLPSYPLYNHPQLR